ncbi:hypothetical protein FB565_000235 [Actinoplanes lutulentus]|uniref:Uncharacterized protein n=1 Tax=Actinoplanes lutulentus TaxID=1287878 RepID=A0A327YXQ9_9ACTN|nr:hypothetical protein [Actinoplanes lutulentus]MBB2940531.1 hypothetical protein [Actinoplanes lutulentus]RAK24801.1 hypothetical protein B0I29_1357 [Actinoplanes lutulentus]
MPAPLPGIELQRQCQFELDLSCGHIVLAWVTGWYPVTVSCCDRLGGTILRGRYVPFASDVDYARVLFEHYGPPSPTAPPQIIGRRARTDEPYRPAGQSNYSSSGRFPGHVGAVVSIDGSIAMTEID